MEKPETDRVERVDGAQARLKLNARIIYSAAQQGGKGGWGSGEIETVILDEGG